jgi:hypothetical protein
MVSLVPANMAVKEDYVVLGSLPSLTTERSGTSIRKYFAFGS